MSVEAGQIVRDALGEWLLTLQLSPEPSSTDGGPPPAGTVPGFPHVGIAWGPVQSTDERAVADSVSADGAATWLDGYDEVKARFMLRAVTAEDADALAHEFRGRFARAAQASNDGDDPVLHFAVEIGGASRTGKVYLDGSFNPPAPAAVAERSLYEQVVGALVVYPRFWVEDLGDETGTMDVSVTVNGTAYAPPEEA